MYGKISLLNVTFGMAKRLRPGWPVQIAWGVNNFSLLAFPNIIKPTIERGCSRSKTTLGSTPTTPGASHMTASLGGRYDPWPVKRSTD